MSVPIFIPTSNKGGGALNTKEVQQIIDKSVSSVKLDLDKATSTSSGSVGGTLVRRDANKDFEGSKVKVNQLESAGGVLSIGGDSQTATLNIASATGPQTVNFGNNGAGITTINLGGGNDVLKVNMPLKNASGANIMNVTSNGNVLVGLGIPANGGGNTLLGNNVSTVMEAAGVWNTAVGAQCLSAITTGTRNVALGHNALSSLTTGENNVGIGLRAGHDPSFPAISITTGSRNTLVGSDTRTATSTMVNSTAIGHGANVDADNTIQLGNTAVTSVKTTGSLTAAGLESIGTTLNIASNNNTNTVNIGSGTGVQTINMGNNGTGATTIKIGGGSDNVHLRLPLRDSDGTAVFNTSGTSNLHVGSNVNIWNRGQHNTLVGTNIAPTVSGPASYNTGVGTSILTALSSGSSNVVVGHSAGNTVTSGHTNTLIGMQTDTTEGTISNGTALGAGAKVDASNTIQLGNTSVTAVKTSGHVITSAIPTAANHLTNKAYVDSKVVTSDQSLNTTDTVTFAGLKLPTILGTPATLNYYEEFDWSTTWKYSGDSNYSSSEARFKIVKIGKAVTMSCVNIPLWNPPQVPGRFSTAAFLPARFRPAGNATTYSRIPVRVINGGVEETGSLGHVAAGVGTILVFANNGEFGATGERSILPFHVSWVTD